MSTKTFPSTELSWQRIGALSASFNLHGVAISLALLAMLTPTAALERPDVLDDTLIAEFVEPPPIQAPAPPTASQPPERIVTRTDPSVRAVVQPSSVPVLVDNTGVANTERPLVEPTMSTIEVEAPAPASSAAAAYASVAAPAYPPMARRQGREGETLLRVLVGVDGRALKVEINRSSGHRELDRAAIIAVRDWRFRAAVEGGVAIESWVEVPIAFRLDRG